MKKISLIAVFKGHTNISAQHETTIEITSDDYLGLRGDCIIGVEGKFAEVEDASSSVAHAVIITGNGLVEKISGKLNKEFSCQNRIVLRKSDIQTTETIMYLCDKASKELSRELIDDLKFKSRRGILIIFS